MHEVVRYLEEVDPEAAQRARYRYGCFEQYGEDSQAYGFAAEVGASRSCENEAIQQLEDLRRRAADLASRDGRIPEDEYFYAEQNARLVQNAEEYYRSMFGGRIASWNLRDQHMWETLDALLDHFDDGGPRTRAVVWAHNTHVGDARATEMGEQGELNLGQLCRENHGGGGCSTHRPRAPGRAPEPQQRRYDPHQQRPEPRCEQSWVHRPRSCRDPGLPRALRG